MKTGQTQTQAFEPTSNHRTVCVRVFLSDYSIRYGTYWPFGRYDYEYIYINCVLSGCIFSVRKLRRGAVWWLGWLKLGWPVPSLYLSLLAVCFFLCALCAQHIDKVLVRIILFTCLFCIQWHETRRTRACGAATRLPVGMLFVVMRLNCCRFVLSAIQMASPTSAAPPRKTHQFITIGERERERDWVHSSHRHCVVLLLHLR